jgi:hypothetical protein
MSVPPIPPSALAQPRPSCPCSRASNCCRKLSQCLCNFFQQAGHQSKPISPNRVAFQLPLSSSPPSLEPPPPPIPALMLPTAPLPLEPPGSGLLAPNHRASDYLEVISVVPSGSLDSPRQSTRREPSLPLGA